MPFVEPCSAFAGSDGSSDIGGKASEENRFERRARLLVAEVSDDLVFRSFIFHATAFSSRIKLASVTRRLKRGSVASVRKVSLRILV